MEYILHGAIINNISSLKNSLILQIDEGIRINGSSKLTGKCIIKLALQDLDLTNSYEHILIVKNGHGRLKEISYNGFVKLVNKYGFKIYLDYYSCFAKAILLLGNINGKEYYFRITEIKELKFMFEK